MVCNFYSLKDKMYQVRATIGGDRLDYQQDTASPATNLLETKLLLNSVISDADKGARCLTMDIKDFFLKTIQALFKRYQRIWKQKMTCHSMESSCQILLSVALKTVKQSFEIVEWH